MELGAFSVSLAVQDIEKSKDFYSQLGFEVFGGDQSQNWLIMKNGDHIIGLFQGMFESNIMTFNPGWNQDAQNTEAFTDVREICADLKSKGMEMTMEAVDGTSGPGNFMITDPDGNVILFDQHR